MENIYFSLVPKNQLDHMHILLIVLQLFWREMVILMLSCIEESLKLIKELMFFHRIIFKICIYYITQLENTCIN